MVENVLKERFEEVAQEYMAAIVNRAPEWRMDDHVARMTEMAILAGRFGRRDLRAMFRDAWVELTVLEEAARLNGPVNHTLDPAA